MESRIRETLFRHAPEASQGLRLEMLKGDASYRSYVRLHLPHYRPSTMIAMVLPDDPHKSEEASGNTRSEELPFINIRNYLARGDIPVPVIHFFAQEQGIMLLEDLGDETFESVVQGRDYQSQRGAYLKALEALVAMQAYTQNSPDPSCLAFERAFDQELLEWELHHFREYILEHQRGHNLPAAHQQKLNSLFAELAAELAGRERVFVHRDFQSRNLMVQEGKLRLIDFQDALLGTPVYDLVALLRDSYVILSEELVDELLAEYLRLGEAAGLLVEEAKAFRYLFDLQTVQRKLKDAGRFVFIDAVKKNPGFLPHIPSSLAYAATAMKRQPRLAKLQEILSEYLPEFK